MNKQDDHKDQRMKWLCTVAPKVAQPLTKAWQQLSALEFAMQQEDVEEDVTDAFIPIEKDGDQLNLSQVLHNIKLTLKCIRLINMQYNQKRRFDLQYKLAGAAKELAEPNQEFSDLIFGPNMDKHLNKIIQANKITYKVSTSQGQ